MINLKVLGLAVIASAAVAGSAAAQSVVDNPGRCSAAYPNANCQNLGRGNPYTDVSYRYDRRHHRVAYRHAYPSRQYYGANPAYQGQYYGWNGGYRTGFWPADVAGDVVGGAVGAAGAIATAPFRAANAAWNDSYAWDRGPYTYGWGPSPYWNTSYAERNGLACTPGTYFRDVDGVHYCR